MRYFRSTNRVPRAARLGGAILIGLAVVPTVTAAARPPRGAEPARSTAPRTNTVRAEAARPKLTITNSPSQRRAVSAGLVGGNLRWVRDADGVLAPNGSLRPAIEKLARKIALRSVRYPGGTVANLFDYRHDLARPGCQTGGGVAWPAFHPIPAADSRFTIDKDARFLAATGSASNVMIPMINSSPARAKGFIRAMAKATHTKHFVAEIGNEPYLPNQHYWRALNMNTRLRQYISGGAQVQNARNVNKGTDAGYRQLFPISGCNLHRGAVADGSANQTYRTRFTPISTAKPPVIDVAGKPWTYVRSMHGKSSSARVFTIVDGGRHIRFGNGHQGAKPQGQMHIERAHPYTAVRQPGFVQFYRALKSLQKSDGISVSVCGGWGRLQFVQAMNRAHHPYDCLAVHSYAVVHKAKTAAADFASLQRQAGQKNADLATMRHAMRQAHAHSAGRRFLEVTEYGTLKSSFHQQKRDFVNTLYLAQLEVGQLETGVRVANLSNFASLFRQFGSGTTAKFRLSSAAHLLALLGRIAGQTPEHVKGAAHRDINVFAARSAKVTSLFVVNRRTSGSWRPSVSLQHRTTLSCVTTRAMHAGLAADDRPTLSSPSPSIQPTTHRTWRRGEAFPHGTFAARSITLVTIAPGHC